MKLTNMKLDPKAREARTASLPEPQGPVYPWGLSISLEEDAIEALGLTDLPDVDATRMLVARVTVTSVSSHQTTEGGTRRSVSLQIIDLALEPEKVERDASTVIYGKD